MKSVKKEKRLRKWVTALNNALNSGKLFGRVLSNNQISWHLLLSLAIEPSTKQWHYPGHHMYPESQRGQLLRNHPTALSGL